MYFSASGKVIRQTITTNKREKIPWLLSNIYKLCWNLFYIDNLVTIKMIFIFYHITAPIVSIENGISYITDRIINVIKKCHSCIWVDIRRKNKHHNCQEETEGMVITLGIINVIFSRPAWRHSQMHTKLHIFRSFKYIIFGQEKITHYNKTNTQLTCRNKSPRHNTNPTYERYLL